MDNKSDKVYIFEIFTKSDFYFLLASWGKRDVTNLASQQKGRYNSLNAATNEMNRLANKKKKRGYNKASMTLDIPGHKADEFVADSVDVGSTTSIMVAETKSDSEVGEDEYGQSYRNLS